MIWYESSCSALFFFMSCFFISSPFCFNILIPNADLHHIPETKHFPHYIRIPHNWMSIHITSWPQTGVLTWFDTLFCQAATGRQSALWQWHALLGLHVWNTVHSDTRHSNWAVKYLTLVRFWQSPTSMKFRSQNSSDQKTASVWQWY